MVFSKKMKEIEETKHETSKRNEMIINIDALMIKIY